MPASTSRGSLPYPLASDPDNVPADIQALAQAVAALLPAGTVVGTSDAQQLQNKDLNGNPTFSGVVTSGGATAGGNGAIPAQVQGYLTIVVNGSFVKLPFYGV